jgi:hypothetical protein
VWAWGGRCPSVSLGHSEGAVAVALCALVQQSPLIFTEGGGPCRADGGGSKKTAEKRKRVGEQPGVVRHFCNLSSQEVET